MITPAYLQRMARYNRWQNENLYGAAHTLGDAARRQERGSFFGSIHATLSHILWADQVWMSRLSDWQKPDVGISSSTGLYDDWNALQTARAAADQKFITWADASRQADIDGDLHWYSGAMGQDMVRAKAICIMQVFNHQTHHRGQVHAMLTAAGAKPDDTDIPFMPDAYL